MIDFNGREIWNTGENNIVYYNTNDALDLLGCYSDNSLEHNLPGIEFSLNTNFVWEEPNDQFLHHDLIKLPNGNYMGIVETSQLVQSQSALDFNYIDLDLCNGYC